jgi:hypothetical protein
MEHEEKDRDAENSLMNIEIDESENEKYVECINISSVFKSTINIKSSVTDSNFNFILF